MILPVFSHIAPNPSDFWRNVLEKPVSAEPVGDFYANPKLRALDRNLTALVLSFCSLFNSRSPVLMVGEPDLVKEVLVKEFNCFVNRTLFKSFMMKPLDRMMTVLCDDHWRHVRSSLSPAYSSGKLKHVSTATIGMRRMFAATVCSVSSRQRGYRELLLVL